MSKLDDARALIREFPLPEELKKMGEEDVGDYADENARLPYYNGESTTFLTKEVSGDVLAQSLSYLIKLNTKAVADEQAVPLGASKYKGLPHLPKGFQWPTGQYFVAQLNLADLHAYDLNDVLPAKGLLYFFFNSSSDCTVHYFDGPLDALVVTEYPDESSLPDAEYYLADFKRESSLISFQPGYVFYLGGDAYDYSDVAKRLPDELTQKLNDILGCSLIKWDSSQRIFGRPLYWQGEDEMPSQLEGMPREVMEQMGIPVPVPQVLLLQDEFGEGNIHFWVDPEALRKPDFSRCWLTYSGT
jgi:hypothetical protein